jgi:phage FluMu gp28-like protein
MSDKIVYVLLLQKRGQLTLRQHTMLIMYTLMGYKIQFLKSNNDICRGYKANIVIDDYLDFDFINTDEILK